MFLLHCGLCLFIFSLCTCCQSDTVKWHDEYTALNKHISWCSPDYIISFDFWSLGRSTLYGCDASSHQFGAHIFTKSGNIGISWNSIWQSLPSWIFTVNKICSWRLFDEVMWINLWLRHWSCAQLRVALMLMIDQPQNSEFRRLMNYECIDKILALSMVMCCLKSGG